MKPDARTPQGETATDESRRKLLLWLWRLPVLAVLSGAGYGLYQALRILNKDAPAEAPVFEEEPPQRVAGSDELAEAWSAAAFAYAGVPALLIRLPVAVPGGLESAGRHYAAFSHWMLHEAGGNTHAS